MGSGGNKGPIDAQPPMTRLRARRILSVHVTANDTLPEPRATPTVGSRNGEPGSRFSCSTSGLEPGTRVAIGTPWTVTAVAWRCAEGTFLTSAVRALAGIQFRIHMNLVQS